jgi:hypothetical protein
MTKNYKETLQGELEQMKNERLANEEILNGQKETFAHSIKVAIGDEMKETLSDIDRKPEKVKKKSKIKEFFNKLFAVWQ